MKKAFLFIFAYTFLFIHCGKAQCSCETVTDPSNEETWDTDNKPLAYSLNCITVEANKTLTIDGLKLKLDCDGGEITIEPGGKLILKDCTIESKPDGNGNFYRYEGIKVEGAGTTHVQMNYYRTYYNPEDSNFAGFGGYNMAHGVLIMQGCTLKHVFRESSQGGTALESYDGGIVEVFDCTFYNNHRDVLIGDYDIEINQTDAPNQFNIINCDFIKEPDSEEIIEENDYGEFFQYVKLSEVKRVQIEGCHFENNFGVVDAGSRLTGVMLFDASVYLQKSGFGRNANNLEGVATDRWGNATKCPRYDTYTSRENRFTNLSYGIKSCGSSAEDVDCTAGTGIGEDTKMGIADCFFINCVNGIFLDGGSPTSDTKVTVSRSLYHFNNSSLCGSLEDISFITLDNIANFLVTENAADVSAQYTTDVSGNEQSDTMLSCILVKVDKATRPDGEIYRNNVDIEDETNTFSGFSCSGSRDKTFPTTGLHIGINTNQWQSRIAIRFGCNDFNKLSNPIFIISKAYLVIQGNGYADDKHDHSTENNFNNCEQPYITWNRYPNHVNDGNVLEYLYDDDDPDPNDAQDEIEESSASSYDCESMGCSKWPIRSVDPETEIRRVVDQQSNNGISQVYGQPWVDISALSGRAITEIRVYDLNGKQLVIEQAKGARYRLNLESRQLAPALYLVTVIWNDGSQSQQKINLLR